MSAVAEVFDTYELLESILLHLPWHRLVAAERVCKPWRDLVQKSSRASKALFRVASGSEPQVNYGLMNPFFLTVFRDVMVEQDRPPSAVTFKELCTMYPNGEASWRKMHIFQTRITCFNIQCRTSKVPYPCFVNDVYKTGDPSLLRIRSSTAITLGDIADEIGYHCDAIAEHADADPGRLSKHIHRFGFLMDKDGPAFSRPESNMTGWQLSQALNRYKDIDPDPASPQHLHNSGSDTGGRRR